VLWAVFFYGQDRYHPLPRRLVVTLFLLGLGATAPTGWLNASLHETFGTDAGAWLLVYGLSAPLEESMKLFFASARVVGEPAVVEPVDGMIAMITVGLGFAAAENTQYIFQELDHVLRTGGDAGFLGTFFAVAPQRGVISTLGHVAWSGIIGYALGNVLLSGWSRWRLAGALGLAAVLHATFNILASPENPLGLQAEVARILALLVWGIALAIFVVLLVRALDSSPYRVYQLRGRLTRLPALAAVPADRMAAAAARLEAVRVEAGEHAATQGAPADRFAVVVEGRFSVSQTPGPGATPRSLPPLGPGDVFGHVALLTGRPTVADVVAETDGMLLTLDPEAFLALVGDDEEVRQGLLDLARAGSSGGLVGSTLRQYSSRIRAVRTPPAGR
jgi:RsiW-degrading membrane proteinase PrsW (M82 family)/CRP-like cAMP-binding protein